MRYIFVTTFLKETGLPEYTNMNTSKLPQELETHCNQYLLGVRDTMDILSGKWKISIIGSLRFGKKRFKELQRDVEGITAKMLSKELRDLEINELVTRTVYNTKPVTVEYEITSYGKTLESVIHEIAEWGVKHRKKIIR
jgi:DNA-binding HxlR family transcriptional regulator